MKEKEFLSVGEIAKRSGVAISTIHFYESKGLIRCHRNAGNQRRFHRRELRVISYIKVAQTIGLSLAEIQEAFRSLVGKDKLEESDWKCLASDWNQVLERKLNLIEKMRAQLSLCIGCGCLSLKDCPLRNPNDIESLKGGGPRFLMDN